MLIFTSPKTLTKDFILGIGNFFIFNSIFRANFYSISIKNIHAHGAMLRKNITLYGNGRLSIGKGTLINEECFLDYSGELIIGTNVAIGMRTTILTSTHHIGPEIRCGNVKRKSTIISNNVWIGANAIIFPGIIIGPSSIISAGETITQDIPSDTLVKAGQFIPLKKSTYE